MNIKKVLMGIGISIIVLSNNTVYALQIITGDEYDFSSIKYENRVHISNTVYDEDFLSDESFDSNGDGTIDVLETNSFYVTDNACDLYIGNAHTRYALQNCALWVGIDGTFESLYIDDIRITSEYSIDAGSPDAVWPHTGLSEFVDSIILVDTQTSVGTRTKDAGIASSNPLHIQVHSLMSNDSSLRLYFSAFGAIKSGFNSVSPLNSSVLFVPKNAAEEEVPVSTQPVPEAGTIVLCCLGIILLLIEKTTYKKGEVYVRT